MSTFISMEQYKVGETAERESLWQYQTQKSKIGWQVRSDKVSHSDKKDTGTNCVTSASAVTSKRAANFIVKSILVSLGLL